MLEPYLLQPCLHVAGMCPGVLRPCLPASDLFVRRKYQLLAQSLSLSLYIYIYICMYIYTYVYIYIYIYVYLSIYMSLSLSIYIYIYIHICIYVHTYITVTTISSPLLTAASIVDGDFRRWRLSLSIVFLFCLYLLMETFALYCLFVYTRSPLEDSRLFEPSPWTNVRHHL